ncbi:MAG TPA: hypothetical protein VI362_08475 [Ignavibacteriaceae bacterium]|nr:hypothetical protein [Ignavibacteriaceae bacterium]
MSKEGKILLWDKIISGFLPIPLLSCNLSGRELTTKSHKIFRLTARFLRDFFLKEEKC